MGDSGECKITRVGNSRFPTCTDTQHNILSTRVRGERRGKHREAEMCREIERFQDFPFSATTEVCTNRCSRKSEIAMREDTRFNVENPSSGKTTGVHNSNNHYEQRMYNGELQGDDLELAILATGGGITQRRRPLFSLTLSSSLSHGYSHFTPLEWKNRKMSNSHKTVCPKSYLYNI